MKRENMTTIRRQLWRAEEAERRERLEVWEVDKRQKVSPDTVLIPEKEPSASEIRLLVVGD